MASLSVRIAEHPREKSRITTDFATLARQARAAGFSGMSLRASVLDVNSSIEQIHAVKRVLQEQALSVSMVTGDLPLAVNNAEATRAIHDVTPYLELAERLQCKLLRVMLHEHSDIPLLQRAADQAAERGIGLAQQCHWGSMAETVDQALSLVAAAKRKNFGITYEPANLLAAGDSHGARAITRLAPYLFNAYFQNLCLAPDSALSFNTRCRGPVGVEFLPLDHPKGIDVAPIVSALNAVGYTGWFTVHQPCLPGQSVESAVAAAGRFVQNHLSGEKP